jgi:hypothetical protein
VSLERDEQHRYWILDRKGRREALGVTRTLIEANLVDDTYFTDRARGRGKLVHLFAEMILTNTLDRPVDASVVTYLMGLRKFLDKYAPTVHGAEIMRGHATRLLAGTCDLEVSILGGEATIEIKTSTPSPWHGLQLAPYCFLKEGTDWLSRGRFGLYLNERGGFRLKEFDDHTDLDYFFRAHELLHWRVKHGSHERPFGRRIDNGAGAGSIELADEDGQRGDGLYGDPPEDRW